MISQNHIPAAAPVEQEGINTPDLVRFELELGVDINEEVRLYGSELLIGLTQAILRDFWNGKHLLDGLHTVLEVLTQVLQHFLANAL